MAFKLLDPCEEALVPADCATTMGAVVNKATNAAIAAKRRRLRGTANRRGSMSVLWDIGIDRCAE
jgi:hypothetical protein